MQSRISLVAVVVALAFLSPPGAQGQSQPRTAFIPPDHAQIIAGELAVTGRADLRVGLIPSDSGVLWLAAIVSAYHECLRWIPEESVRVDVGPDTMPIFFASVTRAGLELLRQCPVVSTILSESRLR